MSIKTALPLLAAAMAAACNAGVESEMLSAHGCADKPAKVKIAKGVHRLTRTLELDRQNSHLRVVGEPGAVVSGAIETKFTVDDKGVWHAKLPAGLNCKMLYVNGHRAVRATEPDNGFYLMQASAGDDHDGFMARPEDVAVFVGKSREELRDVEMVVWQSWDTVRLPPLEVRSDGLVTTPRKHYGYFTWRAYKPRYTIENFREALDSPGEWYLDRKRSELLYLPRPGEKVETSVAEIPLIENLLHICGKAGDMAEDIVFQDVTFEMADWGFPTNGEIGQSASSCTAAVIVDHARGVRFENCTFKKLGQHGVWFREDCHDSALKHSLVEDIGCGAVRIGMSKGPVEPTDPTVTAGIEIRDCILRGGGRLTPEGCGVLLQNARDCAIAHNEIADFRYTGVSVGWTWGYRETPVRNIEVSCNHIHHLGWGYLADMGGIYTLGDCDGSRLIGNYIHDLLPGDYSGWGAHGIYTDEGSHGITIASNFVRRATTGFYQHYGKGNVFRDNVFADPADVFAFRGRNEDHLSFTCENNAFVSSDATVVSAGNVEGGNLTDKVMFKNNLVCAPKLREKAFFGRTLREWQSVGEELGTKIVADYDLKAAEARAYALAGVTGDTTWRKLAESVIYPKMIPPSKPPRYSMPYAEGFERVDVANGMVGEFGASKGLRVVAEGASEGRRCLKATVSEGVDVHEQPQLELWTTGTDRKCAMEFDFRADEGVSVGFNFMDANPIGKPQLLVNNFSVEKGLLLVGDKKFNLTANVWCRMKVSHDFTGAKPVWSLEVAQAGKTIAKVDNLPIDPMFKQWMFFSAVTRSARSGTWRMDNFRFASVEPSVGLGEYTIVVPNGGLTKSEQFVVDDINGLFARSLGKPLPVAPDKKAPKTKRIHIRRAPAWFDYSRLTGKDAAVVVKDGDIWLFGRGVNGVRYAAYDFLTVELGYRFFDARGGVKVPDLAKYEPKDVDRIVRFSFPDRSCSGTQRTGREAALFLFRNGQNKGMEDMFADGGYEKGVVEDDYFVPWPFCHGLLDYFPKNRRAARLDWARYSAKDFDKEKPEFFTLTRDGKRNTDHQPCLSNPEVRRIIHYNYFNRLARLDRPSYVDLSACDTPGRFCWCDNCMALEKKYGTPGGPLLDLLVAFAPEAAEKYPEHKLLMLAYRKLQTEIPPVGMDRLPDNVVPDFAPIDDDFSKDWMHPNNAGTLKNLREWGRLCRDVMIWYYPNPYGEPITPPLGNIRRLVNDIRLMKEAGATAMLFEHDVGVREMTGFSELQSYLIARLFRDTTLDADKLTKEFMVYEYGDAAKGVMAYLKELELLTARCDVKFPWDASHRCYTFITAERMSKWAKSFDAMERIVADDRMRLRNLRRLRLGLDFVTLKRNKDVSVLPRIRAELNELVEDCFAKQYRHDGKAFVKKIESQIRIIETQYGKNAKPLPTEIFGNVPQENLTIATAMCSYGGTVDDSKAAYGTAAVYDSSNEEAAKQMKLPFVANIETFVPSASWTARIGKGVTAENIGKKGEYKFYYMGDTTLVPEMHVEFGGWGMRSTSISDAYSMGAFNKARIYASFKFQGPAFYSGDTRPNKIFCDRIVVVRDWDGEINCE